MVNRMKEKRIHLLPERNFLIFNNPVLCNFKSFSFFWSFLRSFIWFGITLYSVRIC